ncbi:hypothetical protein IJJ05_03475 [Candidatus Saccharibacteria bacterium]|nr:hypothetical protein [Candidatus Saccharibacteria bacterium]
MAEKAEKNHKNLIMWICAILVIAAIVIVAVVLATRGSGAIDESYFKSDDTKYVLTVDAEDMLTEGEEYVPIKSHLVYYYSGNEITSLKSYNEYADANTAKAAYEYYQNNVSNEDYKNIELNGKYVILTANESEYEGTTANDIKQQLELIEMYKNMDFDSIEEEDATIEPEVEVDIEATEEE